MTKAISNPSRKEDHKETHYARYDEEETQAQIEMAAEQFAHLLWEQLLWEKKTGRKSGGIGIKT